MNCVQRAGMPLAGAGEFIVGLRPICAVVGLDAETHDVRRALAEQYGFSVHDAMIVAAALLSGCDRLISEDMRDGLLVEGRLRIENPFAAA